MLDTCNMLLYPFYVANWEYAVDNGVKFGTWYPYLPSEGHLFAFDKNKWLVGNINKRIFML